MPVRTGFHSTGHKMAELVSQREFARRVGVSSTAVQKALRNGRISATPDGRIDFESQIKNWKGLKDQSKERTAPHEKQKQNNRKKPKPERGERYDPVDHTPSPHDASQSLNSYQQAKTAKEIYSAKLRQVEYEEKMKILLPRDDVKAAIYRFCRIVRESITNIPDRVASEVAARLVDYLRPLLLKHLSQKTVDAIINDIRVEDIERVVYGSWDRESRSVLESLGKGPEV